ncbi:hypothetical protein LAZ67_21000883 [Cordylochernes scorpioides]|uniref:RNA-directed DNA polymerase n=1 Tax=Cordylochernes scorpioides TaxID=51811 RepID=A0ABY6LLN0_9ARAC|nr:hypothetical protein LAZ67_21000883 [Cordylochernes scorpioides]
MEDAAVEQQQQSNNVTESRQDKMENEPTQDATTRERGQATAAEIDQTRTLAEIILQLTAALTQDNSHTGYTSDHTSSHHSHTRKHSNKRDKRDIRTKRRQQHHSDTCTITDATTTPLTRNIETIHAIKPPHNRKTLRSFLSAVNAYKRFIPDYARLRNPLNDLLKKDVTWVWDDKCQKAFTSLKESLTTYPILHLYQEGLPCQVYCDASTLGIAGVLKQVHPDGKTYPVQYFSRSLRSHERNYSISELECLAIVERVDKFRVYLMDRKFTLFSDHHALQWLKTIKYPSGRLFRWRLRLSSFPVEPYHSTNGCIINHQQPQVTNPTDKDIMELNQDPIGVKSDGPTETTERRQEVRETGETTAPLADAVTQLSALLTRVKISEGAEATIPPFDGTYNAIQFFQTFDRKMEGASMGEQEKLLRLPNYLVRQPLELFRKLRMADRSYFQVRQTLLDLYPESSEASFAKYFAMKLTGQANLETYYREKTAMGLQLGLPQEVILETLTEGLPFNDQRLVRVVPPENLGEWFRLVQRIHGPSVPTTRLREDQPPTMTAVNAYKEFIPEHARLRTPLVNLLKKDVMWVWSDECQKAFTNLKESLTTHPTLYLYQEGLPCQVHCNTSTFGIAGILKQVYPDGKTYPVQHFSRSLRGHERNYSDLELQCLAIVESVDNFRACLMGRKFTILSDHPALQWLKEIKAPSGRLFRWRLRLSRYEYEVRSINGVQQYETGVVTRIPFCGFLDAPLIKSQQSSPPGKSRVTMDHNELRTVSRKGVLKTLVPISLTARLLKSVHTQHHHPNISKMTRLISSQYYWQNMTQDIAKQNMPRRSRPLIGRNTAASRRYRNAIAIEPPLQSETRRALRRLRYSEARVAAAKTMQVPVQRIQLWTHKPFSGCLNEQFWSLSFARVIAFADDVTFVVWSSNIYDLQYNITKCLIKIKAWCEKNCKKIIKTKRKLFIFTIHGLRAFGQPRPSTVAISRILRTHGINTHFTNSNSIGAILRHPITRLPRSTVARSSGGSVYSVSCNDCSASYIGETVIAFADDVTFVVWSSNIYDLQYNINKCLIKIKAWCEKLIHTLVRPRCTDCGEDGWNKEMWQFIRNAGATRVTSARVDRRILRQAVAAPQATCTAILQHVQDTLDHSISTRTISRRLVANGLHSCRPLRRLPLTPPNRRQRLEWCRARSTWMTEWHRVVFSDESRFCLSSDSRRVRVWRRRGERSNPSAIVERPTVRQRGIIVWGAIAYDSRSPLLRIHGTMTAQRYVDDVLRPVTLPYLQGVPNALYQQDNARPHTARLSQQALQDVQMLPWPPYSPELSPIEHVWDIIGRRLHALPQPRSEDELWQMVEREWRAIPQDAIRTLIDSLPRRVAACIAVRGGPTCY